MRFSRVDKERIHLAVKLLDKYARRKVYFALRTSARNARIEIPYDSKPTLFWNPKEGLSVFLHELGHFKVSKRLVAASHEKLTLDKATTLLDEARAWGWAERTARREGIAFDYRTANRLFALYTGKEPMQVKWKWSA